ncbi:MAG: DUF2845 domain-containing protein [Methylococcales bacterium]|nr:DUF2845 domain-containing protein [Methylococcales bacterium]
MIKKTGKLLILVSFLFIFSEQVLALRCGHRIVDVGANKSKVISRCGQPLYVETREKKYPLYCVDRLGDRYQQNHSIDPVCRYEIIEVWTYNFGQHKFMRELIFQKGVLTDIILLDYGE